MWQLRIRDSRLCNALAFDLRDVLRACGHRALDWRWTVSGVGKAGVIAGARWHEDLDATGSGGDELKVLEQSGADVSGAELVAIAQRTRQVIWGEFRAFRADRREVTIVAFDSSWFDVLSEDKALLNEVARCFSNATLTSVHG